MKNNLNESEFRSYLRILWRWLWLIVLCVILSASVAYTLSSLTTPVYRASTTLLIDNARSPEGASDYRDLLFIERLSQTWAQLMERKSTMIQIAEQLGIEQDLLLADVVSRKVTPIRDTQLMRIDIESVSPTLAALVANTLPNVFIEELSAVQIERFGELKKNLQFELDDFEDQAQRVQIEISDLPEPRTPQEDVTYIGLQTDLSEIQTDRRNLRAQLESIRLAEAQSRDSIAVVESAEVPVDPIRPTILVNTLLAAIVGAMAALGFMFLVEFLDNRVRSPDDLSDINGLSLLGAIAVIPKKTQTQRAGVPDEILISLREPRNPLTEAYRGIRTNLQFASIDTGMKTLMVTSAMPGEGKSTTAANLAIVMAQAGYSVAIVDADMRKPNIHKLFSVHSSPGIVDAILSDEASPLRFSPDRLIQNLKIIPVGTRPPNPSELLGSKRMKSIIERIKKEVDFVVIDAPPTLAVTDAQVLSGVVDKVLLVVGNGTEKSAVQRAVESLQMVDAPLVGYIFNRLDRNAKGDYFYYYEYYGEDANSGHAAVPTRELPAYRNGQAPATPARPVAEPQGRR